MPERLTPGVYVEEVSGGVKPIQGVGTSTAGFIGEAARGIPDRATFITGFRDYERQFGGHRRNEAGFLAQAVEAFFGAGGRRAYVVRVLPASATMGSSLPINARAVDAWGIPRRVLRFNAKGNGNWSSHLRIHIEPATAFQDLAFRVRVEWTEGGRSRTVERFDNLRLDPQHEDYAVEVINETSKYIQAANLFMTEFLDAEERVLPPIPERLAGLETVVESDGLFTIPLNAILQFSWQDATSAAAGVDPAEPRRVEFSAAAVQAAGGALSGDDARLTAVQLRDLLETALNPSAQDRPFRVSIPLEPVSIRSAAGPFDVTGAPAMNVSIDAGRPGAVLIDQAFEVMQPAQDNAGAADFDLDVDDVIRLSINGEEHTHTLVAEDNVTGGAATPQEMANVINRRFPAIRAFLDPADDALIIRTDRVGPSAALAWAFLSEGAVVAQGEAAGSGNVRSLAAVAAAEVAAIFNAGAGAAFEARVDANFVEFIQTDLTAPHTIQWTGPAAIVADGTLHEGPRTPGNPYVRIEPRVASKAYLSVQLPAGANALDLAGTDQITLRVIRGVGVDSYDLDVAATDSLTLDQLADQLNDAVADSDVEVRADAAGEYLVVTAEAQAAGVALQLTATPGDPPWRRLSALPGRDGHLAEAQNAVEIKVSEVLQLGVPRALGGLMTAVRAAGLAENSSTNPNLRPATTGDTPVRLLGGSDGTGPVTLAQYRGSETGRSGLHAFDTADINLLLIPGRNEPGFISAAMSYCDANDIFYIADGPGNIDRQFEISTAEVQQFVEGLPSRSNNAAMFYPWIEVPDPVGIGRNPKRFVPPAGHMAGVFARTDVTRGVWKAPAGIEAQVSGAIDLQHQLVDADQDLLNPIGLNCLRSFPNTGIVVWGSRTLAADPEWRYVPVRRTALFLKESLRRGLKWAVFEPNDQELWDRIRINIGAFMLGLFRQGAFQGATPEEAFRVKCDRETNPQELVDQGIVTAQVAFAPLKPAEFVVIEISQKTLLPSE